MQPKTLYCQANFNNGVVSKVIFQNKSKYFEIRFFFVLFQWNFTNFNFLPNSFYVLFLIKNIKYKIYVQFDNADINSNLVSRRKILFAYNLRLKSLLKKILGHLQTTLLHFLSFLTSLSPHVSRKVDHKNGSQNLIFGSPWPFLSLRGDIVYGKSLGDNHKERFLYFWMSRPPSFPCMLPQF